MGSAGAVAIDDCRQALHVGTEYLRYRLLLGFAQFWELLGDVRHRAMMLTDLHTVDRTPHLCGGRDVAGFRQCTGDSLGGGFDLVVRIRAGRLDTGQDRVYALPREAADRLLAADLPQLAHRGRGQVVVAVVQLRAAGRGEPVSLGRASPPGLLPSRGGRRLGFAHVDQHVKVASHASCGQPELFADLPGGDRPGLQQQPNDGATSLTVMSRRSSGCFGDGDGVREFHNTSVTQFWGRVQQGYPLPRLRWSHLTSEAGSRGPLGTWRRPAAPGSAALAIAAGHMAATRCARLRRAGDRRYAAVMADRHHSLSSSIASLHGDEQAVGQPLNNSERVALGRTRVFGATGTVLMGIGALGAGARPVVQDPTFGVRLLNLPSRIQTVSLTMTTTGAVMMALAWLMLGRFALGKRRMSRGDLDRTLLLWVLPLLIAPPMFSKDVYSYLAQSRICWLGLDPYRVGPATGLGLGHVFTLSVPSLWRETPAPYGPLFLWMGRGISALTGENIVAAVLCHRLVVLLGVGLIVWATPRLARRCGVAEVTALWLGAANPLLIMHLVAGIHNEAPMLGLMLAGTEFALRGVDSTRPLWPRPWPRASGDRADWTPLGMLLIGSILIVLSSQIKLPSLLALGFVTMALARRYGGGLKAFLLTGTMMAALSLAVMAAVGSASRLGFGWIYTLGTANVVRSWMSPPTLLALGTGQVGILLGLGDHTTAVLSLTRGIGVLIIGVLVAWLLLSVLRGRLHPVGGLGVALGGTVLLFPVVQPWYLLWAIIPLAAWATRPGFRLAVIIVTLVVGIFGPTANGDRFALFQIVDATVASTVVVLVLIAVTYDRLPWRPLLAEELTTDAAKHNPQPSDETPQPDPLPGAYAQSS